MEWETFYNCHRPHASLKGKTPYEILLLKVSFSIFQRARPARMILL